MKNKFLDKKINLINQFWRGSKKKGKSFFKKQILRIGRLRKKIYFKEKENKCNMKSYINIKEDFKREIKIDTMG